MHFSPAQDTNAREPGEPQIMRDNRGYVDHAAANEWTAIAHGAGRATAILGNNEKPRAKWQIASGTNSTAGVE
jgi:hypothetical protein